MIFVMDQYVCRSLPKTFSTAESINSECQIATAHQNLVDGAYYMLVLSMKLLHVTLVVWPLDIWKICAPLGSRPAQRI
jgi:hypothetical protein